MQTLIQQSLLPYNSFGINATAAQLMLLEDASQLADIPTDVSIKILGGGTNVLLTKNQNELIIANRLTGKKVVREDEDVVWLEVAAGENWHQLVLFTLAQGWAGLENLSLIPGTVGASPIQNIGAYGVEVKDLIEEVQLYKWAEQKSTSLTNEACGFGYRDSIFKRTLGGTGLITSVTFRLSKKPQPNTSYGAINQQLAHWGITEPSIADVSKAVIAIRQSKLPDPTILGNAGSFFKNPSIPKEAFQQLLKEHPTMPAYPMGTDFMKVPAGWLIESLGWKGYREGAVGVHAQQALVLVNYGGGTGEEVYHLSTKILDSVANAYGIMLEREVQIW